MISSDERGTPPALWEQLHSQYVFTLDACASGQNSLLPRYNTADEPLRHPWAGERVYANVPFSDIPYWVIRAHASWEAELVYVLVPSGRQEQPWWQRWIEPHRDGRRPMHEGWALTTHYLPGRTRFLDPDGKRMGSPKFGCAGLVWSHSPVRPGPA